MKKHILSVDDEPDIRELLDEALSMQGYRVTTTGQPEEAKRIVQADPPQLIIMDFQIEEGDGFVTIDALKKLAPTTPIILLTGAAFDKQVVRDTILKIVSSYLGKTASLSQIVTEVEKLIGPAE